MTKYIINKYDIMRTDFIVTQLCFLYFLYLLIYSGIVSFCIELI